MPILRLHYSQDADTLYRWVTDPANVKARSEALGEHEVRVTKSGETITNVREVDAELPSFAKKLFKPRNTVEDVKAWDASTKRAKMTVDVRGTPTKITADIAIVPSGTGCDYVIDFTVSVKIPLIGGKIESFVTGLTEKGFRDEHAFTVKQLGA